MTYQNRQSSFMLVSTAAIKRGSMKIDPPVSERTRSQAVRSTAPIELKTRFVYGMRRRHPEEAQRKRSASPRLSATSVVRPIDAVMAVECRDQRVVACQLPESTEAFWRGEKPGWPLRAQAPRAREPLCQLANGCRFEQERFRKGLAG